jgi:trk system potassium uptake protein TrkA
MLVGDAQAAAHQFGGGEVELIEVEIGTRLVGRCPRDLSVPGEILPVSIVRRGRAFLPTPGVPFELGDVLHVAVRASAVGVLETMIR